MPAHQSTPSRGSVQLANPIICLGSYGGAEITSVVIYCISYVTRTTDMTLRDDISFERMGNMNIDDI